jgi:hypothetical protein
METTIVALIFFAVMIALLAVRILFVKDGEFRGTCSTQKQALADLHDIQCTVCGKPAGESECGMPDEKTALS